MRVAIMDQEYVYTFDIKDDVAKAAMVNDIAKQKLLEIINKECDMSFKPEYTKIIDLTGKHLCLYCGEVVDGLDEDKLCAECRDVFGHAFYSEL